MQKADFANNLYVKKGKYGTNVSIKVDAFIEDLKAKKNKEGWVTIEIKETKAGDKLYAVFSNWEPKGGSQSSSASKPQYKPAKVESNDDLPF